MDNKIIKTILKLLIVIGLIYWFLVSIGLLGAAFKGFGKGFAETLLTTTNNPFVGLFIGILATSLVQSSSTTTSILVGIVASGVITIENAIPVIMGANIGTTVTNTLVSLAHITRREEFKRAIAGATVHDFFNLICVAIIFPLELMTGFLQKTAMFMSSQFESIGGIKFTSPLKMVTKPTINYIKNMFLDLFEASHNLSYILILVVSIIIMYFTLFGIVKVMKSLVLDKTETVLNNILTKGGIVGIFAGIIFTIIVQSSSITTSLLIPMIAAGIVTIEFAFPVTLGANIGTTGTAILASLATGNIAAITIAFVHFLFNFIGVVIIYPIKIFRTIPIRLAKGLSELAFKKRRYAIFYVTGVFFILPALMILISKLFN